MEQRADLSEKIEQNLPCEVVQDLLPGYVDELTSPVTNEMVKEHLESCSPCKEKYMRMKSPVEQEMESSKEKIELDFLQKTRKRNRKILFASVAIVWLFVVIFLGIRYYFAGKTMNAEYLSCGLSIQGKELTATVKSTSGQGIRSINIYEEEGVVEISVTGVTKSIFFDDEKETTFTSSEAIRQVWVGDRILWADGEPISPLAANLYALYNPYVGNMPFNGKLVRALNLTAFTGNFINELQTKQQPYSWKMILEKEFSSSRQESMLEWLPKYAYLLLSQIGNLDEVVYEYTIEGKPVSLSVTSKQATEYAGVDIKTVGQDIVLLEQLVRKTGLSNVMTYAALVESNAQVDDSMAGEVDRVLGFVIVNYTENEICGMNIAVECGGATGHQGMTNADHTALQQGLNVEFQLLPEDFTKEFTDGEPGKITLSVVTSDGEVIPVQGEVTTDLIWGTKVRLNLSGNSDTGYFLGR